MMQLLENPATLVALPPLPVSPESEDRRQQLIDLLWYVEKETRSKFQPSTLESKRKLTTFAGVDPATGKAYATPQGVSDRLQYLFSAAQALNAMVGQEGEICMQLIYDTLWDKLGSRALDHLCLNGVLDPTASQRFTLYQPLDLTISLVGIQAALIWEMERTI